MKQIRAFIVLAICVALCGCGWLSGDSSSAFSGSGLHRLLELAPESSQLSIGAQRISGLTEQIEAMGLGGNATIQDAIASWSITLGVQGDATPTGIANKLRLDPEGAIAIFMRPESEDEAFALAIAAYSTDVEKTLKAGARIVLSDFDERSIPQMLAVDTPAIVEGSSGTVLNSENIFVIGTDSEFVAESSRALTDPTRVIYGDTTCEPSAPDAIVGLAKVEHLDAYIRAQGWDVIADAITANADEGAPGVFELWSDDAGVNFRARIHHGDGAPKDSKPLTLAPLLPTASEAFVGWRMGPEGKEFLREQWIGMLPESLNDDPLYAMAATQLDGFLHAIDDEVALTALGLSAGQPQFAGLFKLRDEGQAADILGGFSSLFTQVDTVGETPVYGLPPEMGVPVAYAIHNSVLVLAPDPEMAAGAVTQIEDGSPTNLFPSMDPSIDPKEGVALLGIFPRVFLEDLVIPFVFRGGWPPGSGGIRSFISSHREIRVVRKHEKSWESWHIVGIPDTLPGQASAVVP